MMHLSTSTLLLALTALFLVGFWLLPGGVLDLRRLADGRLQVDLRPVYGVRTVYTLLDAYGERGRSWFGRMLRTDLVFPLVYAAAIWTLAVDYGATRPHAVALAQGAGLAAACFDEFENILLLHILAVYPARRAMQARLAGSMTLLKMCSFAIAIGSLASAISYSSGLY